MFGNIVYVALRNASIILGHSVANLVPITEWIFDMIMERRQTSIEQIVGIPTQLIAERTNYGALKSPAEALIDVLD